MESQGAPHPKRKRRSQTMRYHRQCHRRGASSPPGGERPAPSARLCVSVCLRAFHLALRATGGRTG
eukprot:5970753-Alexandrium_andersonii.AAC.1